MSGPNWFDREEDQLVSDLNDGLITRNEFNAAMRNLREELRQAAQEEADAAYDAYMGGW